jgi:hypothetical protein
MKKIFKYPIPVADEFFLQLSVFAEILTVQLQKSEPQIWVLIDPDDPKYERKFHLYGTGMSISNDPHVYIGSFQMLQGALVYHLFEVTELPF